MPSFDIVSKVDEHELVNAVDQANRELANRFDFRGIAASFTLKELKITVKAPSDFQVKQMVDILQQKLTKRGIDARSLKINPMETNLHEAKQLIDVKQGIDMEVAKNITKKIKETKFKVQASIQGDQVRVTGNKRDDLQDVIAFLRKEDVTLPLQFENFRD